MSKWTFSLLKLYGFLRGAESRTLREQQAHREQQTGMMETGGNC